MSLWTIERSLIQPALDRVANDLDSGGGSPASKNTGSSLNAPRPHDDD